MRIEFLPFYTVPGQQIWYTTDGTEPIQGAPSTLYAGAFALGGVGAKTLKARTFASGYANSSIATVNYFLQTAGAGEYIALPKGVGQMLVDASSSKPTSPPSYAIDGAASTGWQAGVSTPGPWLRLDFGAGIERNIGRVSYLPASNLRYTVEAYRIFVTSDPSSSPAAWGAPVAEGTFTCCAEQVVTFTAKVGRFVILQALSSRDGGIVYTPGLPRVGEITVFVTGGGALPEAAQPVTTPAAGQVYATPLHLSLSSATAGAEIWCTTDGSEPVQSAPSILYTGPVNFGGTGALLIKSKAFHPQYSPSPTSSSPFTLEEAAPGAYVEVRKAQMTADASSEINGAIAGRAIDNHPVLRWESVTTPNGIGEWLRLDFGAGIERHIGKLTHTASCCYGDQFNVYITSDPSTDPANWGEPVALFALLQASTIEFPPQAGRFVILQCDNSVDDHAEIVELGVYDTKAGAEPSVSPPQFSLPDGEYVSPVELSMSIIAVDGEIWYTDDGSEPAQGAPSTLYGGPIVIEGVGPATIKAKGFAPGLAPSATTTGNYVLTLPTAATPQFSPAAGSYLTPLSVQITSATGGASIWYTTDGTEPVQGTPSLLYSGPFNLTGTGSKTVKAKSFASGYSPSATASATYNLTQATVATPVFSPNGGTFAGSVNVTMTCATPGAEIWYAVGSYPKQGPPSIKYTGPVTFSTQGSTVVKAVAFKTGMNASPVRQATIIVTP